MKKILFYINTLRHGGAERVISNLASEFSKHNYKVVLVTSFKCEEEYTVHKNVKRVYLYEKNINENFFSKNLKFVKRLRQIIKYENPNVSVSFMAEPNFRLLIATLGMKTKKVISVRNDPNYEYPNFIYRFLAKTLYFLADGIVFQTKDAKEWFPKGIQRKSKIILNPVADKFYQVQRNVEKQNIIAIGRYEKQKNFEMLIKAYSLIARMFPEEKLLIYGQGIEKSNLESLIM